MPKGLPIAYIKKWGISKKAWREFRKGTLTKGVPTRKFTSSRVKKLTKRSVKTMTRRKRGRGKRKFTLPIAPIVGLAAGLAAPVKDLMDGEPEYAMNKLKYSYLGLTPDNVFKPEALMSGLVPLVVGCLVHKFVGGAPLNLNRMLASANVPVIRI